MLYLSKKMAKLAQGLQPPKLQKSFKVAEKILIPFSCHSGHDEEELQLSMHYFGFILLQCIRQFMDSEVQSFKKSAALWVSFNLWLTILPLLSSPFEILAPQSKTEVPKLHKVYYVIHFGTQCTLVLELFFALHKGVEIPNFWARCCKSTQLGNRLASQKKNNILLVSIWLLCGINEQQPFSQLSQLAQNLIADNEGNYSCVFCFLWQDWAKAKD